MAIDFMVMPMSRHISGDFVTPAMRVAWELGVPYSIVTPEGQRELPMGLPYGGAEAGEFRARIVPMVLEDLRALPSSVSDNLWDEASEEEPHFYRVDTSSYDALLEFLSTRQEVSLFGLRRKPKASHSAATLILPCAFDEPIQLTSPFERTAGSAQVALRELATLKIPEAARSAAETLRGATQACLQTRLPMIVDS